VQMSRLHWRFAEFDYGGRKYKFMESNLGQRRKGLEENTPEIRKTLEMATFLKERKVCFDCCVRRMNADRLQGQRV
jgi:hypothetical protein